MGSVRLLIGIEIILDTTEILENIVMHSVKDIIFTLSREGILTSLNTEFESMLGLTRGECLRKSWTEFLYPDDITDAEIYIQNLIAGQSSPIKELRFLTKNGDCKIFILKATINEKSEKVKEIIVVAHDITENKRTEQRIQMFAHTITSMHECVVITDLKQRIIFVNPAFTETYGYPEQKIIGSESIRLFSSNTPNDIVKAIYEETLINGWQGEMTHARSTGDEFPVMLSTSAIYNQNSKPIACALIIRDRTEQNRLEEQIKNAILQREEDLRQFTYSLQHAQEEERKHLSRELHDALGQMVTLIQINLERSLNQTQKDKKNELINNALAVTQGVLTRLHEIALLLRPPVMDDFGLKETIETYLRDFETKTGILIEFNFMIDAFSISKEISVCIFRILQEAMTNVSKHSGADIVDVRLWNEENQIMFMIEDHGSGFTDISSSKRKNSLGLLGMRERAELLGGTFSLTTNLGSGTKILVSLPIDPRIA